MVTRCMALCEGGGIVTRKNLRRIYTLTAQPEGPTGREMEKIAEEIVEVAQENATDILFNLVSKHPEILNTIQFTRRGREIVVGIRPDKSFEDGPAAYYLASKEQREHIWLTPAVEEVMNRHPHITASFGPIR